MTKKAPPKLVDITAEQDSNDSGTDELKGQTQREAIEEYIKRLKVLENEVETLKESKKDLDEEFKDKLDLKTLKQALRVHKIRMDIDHQDTFDEMLDLLEKEMGSL